MTDYLARRELIAALDDDSSKSKELLKRMKKEKTPDFVAFIDNYIATHGIQRSFVIKKAYLSPQYGYKILNGSKHTYNRNIIIRICLALKMNMEDIQHTLMCYNMRPLNNSFDKDYIICLGIEENKGIYDIDIWLRNAGLEPLIEDCT